VVSDDELLKLLFSLAVTKLPEERLSESSSGTSTTPDQTAPLLSGATSGSLISAESPLLPELSPPMPDKESVEGRGEKLGRPTDSVRVSIAVESMWLAGGVPDLDLSAPLSGPRDRTPSLESEEPFGGNDETRTLGAGSFLSIAAVLAVALGKGAGVTGAGVPPFLLLLPAVDGEEDADGGGAACGYMAAAALPMALAMFFAFFACDWSWPRMVSDCVICAGRRRVWVITNEKKKDKDHI